MEVTEGKLKRLRNLPAFKDKSEEELIEYLKNKEQKPRKPRTKKADLPLDVKATRDYDKRYNDKFNMLKDEFGIDMNDANDAENLRIYIRSTIQLEDVDERIKDKTNSDYVDTKILKELGEFKKTLVNSITDLQDKLAITRKSRKEKQVDDIPQYLKEIRRKAKDFWNRTTTSVKCEKCEIELVRYWLNFPDLANKVVMENECWKCGEKVVHVR